MSKRRVEKQQLKRDYEIFLQEEQDEAIRQQRLEEEAEDLYWANMMEYESFRLEQAKREAFYHQHLEESDDLYLDFMYYDERLSLF